MHVLIIDDNLSRQAELTIAFMRAGFLTTATASHEVAETAIRNGVVDLVVGAERVRGRLTHSLALLAEWRNGHVATILMTDRTEPEVDELFELIPSLHCLVPPDMRASGMLKLGLSSVAGAVPADAPIILPDSLRVQDEGHLPLFLSSRAPAFGHPLEAVA